MGEEEVERGNDNVSKIDGIERSQCEQIVLKWGRVSDAVVRRGGQRFLFNNYYKPF